MIKREKQGKIYHFNPELISNILALIKNPNSFSIDNCTKEQLATLMDAIANFLDKIRPEEVTVTVEEHETEEQAREYFGQEFITELNGLITKMDKEETIVSIHGAPLSACETICETGVHYKSPQIRSIAVPQKAEFGQKPVELDSFESLLNWSHKQRKGLVLIAVPYECYYKEGLWEHFSDEEYGYRIRPEFIVGYIDVENKKIVLNPRYKRDHDYSGLEPDSEIFHKNDKLNNDSVAEIMIETSKWIAELKKEEEQKEKVVEETDEIKDSDLREEELDDKVESLMRIFNGITHSDETSMSEEKYKQMIRDLKEITSLFVKVLPKLPTEEEMRKLVEQQSQFPFVEMPQHEAQQEQAFDFDPDEYFKNEEWAFPDEGQQPKF